MRKYILFGVFFVLLVDIMFGIGLKIATGLSFKNVALYAAILMILVDAILNPSGVQFSDLDIHLPFVVLLTFIIFSLTVQSAFDPTYATRAALIQLKGGLLDHYLFFLAFRYGLRSEEDFLWLLKAILATLLLSSIFTFVDYLDVPDLGVIGMHKGRVEGPVGEANQYGALLVFLLPAFFVLADSKTGMVRGLWFTGVLISFFLLVATGSRGAFLAVVIGYPIAAIYLRQFIDLRRFGKMLGLAIVALTLSIIAVLLLRPDLILSIVEKSTAGGIDQISSGRLFIWTAALKLMLEWPASFLIGMGWHGFNSSGIPRSSHNVYLAYFYEMGAVGFSLFLALLWVLISRTRRVLKYLSDDVGRFMIAYVLGMTGIILAIFFVALPRPWKIVWTITGLIIGLQNMAGRTGSSVGPRSQSNADQEPRRVKFAVDD